jgi:WD40 repeat protein
MRVRSIPSVKHDGLFIASGGEDMTVRVWNATTGEAIGIYSGHTAGVMSIAWSPDGKRIAFSDVGRTGRGYIDRLLHHGEVFYVRGTSYRLKGKEPVTLTAKPEGVGVSSSELS